MTARTKIAFWCYVLLLIAVAGWGMNFLLRSEFTDYHSVAVGMSWSEVPSSLQVLILACLKLAGGLWIAFCLAVLLILLLPFRQGVRWALWAVPLLLVAQFLAPVPAMTLVIMNTPATPPWMASTFGILVSLFGLLVSVTGKQTA